MDPFIYILLALLAALACCDLFVGVSNDAVNFLNSAVGCRTAPFWVIMAVASAGVLLGASFSSGMMEIAKTGVFLPERLTFNEVIVIFVSVVVTDVLLLNTFNSLGLPTSTTVSIIFELLGGALAMACYKIWNSGEAFSNLSLYINSAKALAMIMGILLSVIIAFCVGLVIQYILRVLFTFQYQAMYRRLGGLYGGCAITAIVQFLVMKGARGASFMEPEWIEWLDAHQGLVIVSVFVVTTVVLQALILLRRVNIFPFIILSGTFALAFAFAGNDLVNFVGVPLAALDSYTIFANASAAGTVDGATFTMEGLREVTRTPTIFLAASGLIMCLTLWFSKKAHRVIRTSVNLASSARGGKEQFGSSLPARVVVRGSLHVKDIIHQILPESFFKAVDTRFVKKKLAPGEEELPFDEVRASVNLVLAAALIATATSLKLPLSTTYVSFMVAMGSSLADRAWDRESAVYRISGVFTVISGWFLTAFTAAIASGFVCSLFIVFGRWGMLIGAVGAFILIVRSNFLPEKKKEAEAEEPDFEALDGGSMREILSRQINRNLARTLTIFSEGLTAFIEEDNAKLAEIKGEAVSLYDETTLARGRYYDMALEKLTTKADRDARNFYYRAYSSMKEVCYSLRDQLGVAENYVANSHSPFTGRMRERTMLLASELQKLRDNYSTERCTALLSRLEEAQKDFLQQISEEQISLRKSELYLGYFVFARDALNRYMMVKLVQSEYEANFAKTQPAPAPAAG